MIMKKTSVIYSEGLVKMSMIGLKNNGIVNNKMD